MPVTGSNGTGSLQVDIRRLYLNWNTGSASTGSASPTITPPPTSGQIFPRGILGN